MGCRILSDRDNQVASFYCSTSDWAFGPVFSDSDEHDADERAEAFTRWLKDCNVASYERADTFTPWRGDPRQLTEAGLGSAYGDWLAQEKAQWAREEAPELEAQS